MAQDSKHKDTLKIFLFYREEIKNVKKKRPKN